MAIALASASGCAGTGATTSLPPAPATVVEEPAVLATSTGEIHGTLELPAARFPVPVVLIIAGSGPTDRNGNSPAFAGPNNSLEMLADGLANRGIATLRYDKRGIAASRSAASNEADLRFGHFIDDATSWARKLRADPRFSTVTIAGHSEGSLIGMVAARQAGAHGYVSIAGAGRKPSQVISEQLSAQLPPAIVAQADEAMRKIEAGEKPDSVPPMLNALFRPSVQPYLISWFAVSPVAEIARLDIPVLIVQGTTDLQITEKDARALADAKPGSRLSLIEGMNHVLKPASGPIVEQIKSYSDSTIAIVPQVVDEIASFVKSIHIRQSSAFGIDKLKHFLMAGYVESVTYAGMQAAGADRETSLATALGAVGVASVGKEMHDRRTGQGFSVADLVWDALGAGAAWLILAKTQR